MSVGSAKRRSARRGGADGEDRNDARQQDRRDRVQFLFRRGERRREFAGIARMRARKTELARRGRVLGERAGAFAEMERGERLRREKDAENEAERGLPRAQTPPANLRQPNQDGDPGAMLV